MQLLTNSYPLTEREKEPTLWIGAIYGSTNRSQLRIKQPNSLALSSLPLLSTLS